MSDATKTLKEVIELLPPGKVPGGFERDFCNIFRPEIEKRFADRVAQTAKESSGQ